LPSFDLVPSLVDAVGGLLEVAGFHRTVVVEPDEGDVECFIAIVARDVARARQCSAVNGEDRGPGIVDVLERRRT
jgi:hypothetical protein